MNSYNQEKVAIVRLGETSKKIKYTIFDAELILLADHYMFESRVQVDSNGTGALVYVWAYPVNNPRECGLFMHDLIWQSTNLRLKPKGFEIIHINGNTVDNRIANLKLQPKTGKFCFAETVERQVRGMYWTAIRQIPIDHTISLNAINKLVVCYYNDRGEPIDAADCENLYFECNYTPCTFFESNKRSFISCRYCEEARYCSIECRNMDVEIHAHFCKRPLLEIDYQPDR